MTATVPPTTAIRVARPDALPPPEHKLVVVEASAGTGKTFFLEHRVVDLIVAGAELSQILLVTFTDKAVAELRMRIRDLLDRLSRLETSTAEDGARVWELDAATRRRLRASVTAFDHAPIFTIHGFCHRVLIEDAFAARRLFEQRQVADDVAFDAAFAAVLRERFARVQPDRDLLAAFLATGRSVDKLREILLGCARAGQDARVRRYLDVEGTRATVARLHAVLGTPELRAQLHRELPKNGNERRWMEEWLREIGATLPAIDAPPPRLLVGMGELRETVGKLHKYAAQSPAHAELAAALRAAATAVSLDEAVAAQLLPAVLARIEADKAEQGHFDYDDMLQLVWRALCGPRRDELAERLRARTPWVMIDEFQDTDPVQWNIFRSVWMHEAARGLTIVGDPKQAIYGFRGADVNTYLAARDEMLRGGATRVALDVNRRSTEPLVEAVNTILVGNLAMPLLEGPIAYDEPVRASGDVVCADVRPPVAVLALRATGKATVDVQRTALAQAIGDGIEALRAAPPAWTVRGKPPGDFRLGHVMVLTRTNKDSTEIAAALRARGLPCALVEPERLFDTREASELAAVLAAIASPRDRSARMRALRTRFFDVPWADLMTVVDAPDHHPLIARFFDWAQLAVRRSYETLFRRLIEDSRYAERALVLGGGERALTNTWHLIELLLAEVARSRSDLHELVARLRRWMADPTSSPDEHDVQRTETDADAIRILTIHKAKGLEAPYVFVYGGLSPGPKGEVHTLRDAAGRAILVGAQDPETKALLEQAADRENQRLAYVALTRAQIRLYLPLYAEGALKDGSAYGPIQRCLLPLAGRGPIGGRVLFEVVDLPLGAPEPTPAPLDALAALVTPPAPVVAPLAPLPAHRTGLAMLSYTRLAHDLEAPIVPAHPGDALAIDPAEFDVDDPSGTEDVAPLVGEDELPPGADAGLLLHDVLETADLAVARAAADAPAWAADPAVAAQLADAARARGIEPRYLPHAAALAHAMLTQPLALADGYTLPPLVDAAGLAREVEFSYPIPAPPGGATRGLVRGFIDALVTWPGADAAAPGGDELWVLDYKSDLLLTDAAGSAAPARLLAAAQRRVREHYAVQARLYAIAADRMRGRRKLAGLLFAFVRHGIVVPIRIGDDTLAAWQAWLAAITTPAPAPGVEVLA